MWTDFPLLKSSLLFPTTPAPSPTCLSQELATASPSCPGEGWSSVGAVPWSTNLAFLGQVGAPAGQSCITWGPAILSYTLTRNSLNSTKRYSHVAWTPPSQSNSIVLLSGLHPEAKFTAEIVPGFERWSTFHSLCYRWRNLWVAPQWKQSMWDSWGGHNCNNRRHLQ